MDMRDRSLRVLCLFGSRGFRPPVSTVLQRREFLCDLKTADSLSDFKRQAASGMFDAGLVDFGALPGRESDRLKVLGKLNSSLPLILLIAARDEKQARRVLSTGSIRDYVVKSTAQVGKLPFALRAAAFWGSGIARQNRMALEAKQAAILQEAVYQIAQAADLAPSLDDLFPRIHSIISQVMPAGNFYIALTSPRKGYFTLPYYVDEMDEAPEGEQSENGLTHYVLHMGRSLICDESAQNDLAERGVVDAVGSPSKVWLGVPLIVDGSAIGVMVVQHYQDPLAYGKREQRMLEFVSSQVALVIKRKQAEDALRASEENFRSLFENSPLGMWRIAPDGRNLLANPTLVRMLGFDSLEEMREHNNGRDDGLLHPCRELRDLLFAEASYSDYVSEFNRKDGSLICIRESARAIRGPDGTLLYFDGITEDITEQRKISSSLHEKVVTLQTMTEIDHDIILARHAGDILELVCRSAAHLLKTAMAVIVSTSGGRWSLEATFGIRFPEQLNAKLQEMDSGDELFNPVSFSINELSESASVIYQVFSEEGARSVLAETLSTGMVEQGILLVLATAPRTWTEDDISLLKTLAGQAAIALDKVRMLTEAERRGDEFAALNSVSASLAGERDLQWVLSMIVNSVKQLMNTPSSFIYLFNENLDILELSIASGVGFPAGLTLKMGEGMAGRVAETRKPLLVKNYRKWENRLSKLDETNYSSVLEVPMLFGGTLIGVLGVAEVNNEIRVFTEQDERLLSLFAAQGASAVYNARLFDAIQNSNKELDRLYRASDALIGAVASNIPDLCQRIAHVVVSEFQQSNCSVWLLEGEPPSLERFAIQGATSSEIVLQPLTLDGSGLIAKAIRSGQLVNVPDVQLEPDYLEGWTSARSELVLPLKNGERIIGVLDLQSSDPAAFREDEVRVLSRFVSRAGLMLEHARLVSETEQRLHRLSALHTVDIAVASSLDLQVTLKVFLEQVTSQLRVDAADLLLVNPHLQVLEYAAGRGFRGAGIRRSSLRIGEDAAGRAALERTVIGVSRLDLFAGQVSRPERIAGEGFVSVYAVPLIARGKMKGVLELYFRNLFTANLEWKNFVETLARQAAVAIDDAHLFEQLQRSYTELSVAYDSTIEGWARLLELRSAEPGGHSHSVSALTVELARRLGVSEQDLTHVYRGALLHDIGKLAIPDSVLLKPGSLNDDEWAIIRTHPVIARDLLVSIDYLRPAAVIPYAHHEKWEGSGYPRGLKAEQIPLVARIFSVVDVWDTLKRDQPYRPAWSEAAALEYIRSREGADFDPMVVKAFLDFLADGENQSPSGLSD